MAVLACLMAHLIVGSGTGGDPHLPPSGQMAGSPAPIRYMMISSNNPITPTKSPFSARNALFSRCKTPHPYKKISLTEHFLQKVNEQEVFVNFHTPTPTIKNLLETAYVV